MSDKDGTNDLLIALLNEVKSLSKSVQKQSERLNIIEGNTNVQSKEGRLSHNLPKKVAKAKADAQT